MSVVCAQSIRDIAAVFFSSLSFSLASPPRQFPRRSTTQRDARCRVVDALSPHSMHSWVLV